MAEPRKIVHPIEPFYRPDSRILILGSFPSVKTREMGFFYGHPQNRFWRVAAAVFHDVDPGIDQFISYIHHKIHDDDQRRQKQRRSHNHGIVPVEDT